jgi:phosphatidylserine/phosphatidylglycerophosphate/cardiolipin synthase-like enzyme
MKGLFLSRPKPSPELLYSKLFNEGSFHEAFLKDLNKCLHEAIIESPFITHRRLSTILPTLEKLKQRGVRVTINTRDPLEHDNEFMRLEAVEAISNLQHAGIHVLLTGGHHRKLAIIDRSILWEGSLNILSQNNSCEVMRRIESAALAWQMARFIKVDRFLS